MKKFDLNILERKLCILYLIYNIYIYRIKKLYIPHGKYNML